jgi:beta-glucosidase
VTRPVRELKGFRRITIAPGETVDFVFELNIQDLAFYGKDMVKKVEPGKFQVWIAPDSASGTPAEFEVK